MTPESITPTSDAIDAFVSLRVLANFRRNRASVIAREFVGPFLKNYSIALKDGVEASEFAAELVSVGTKKGDLTTYIRSVTNANIRGATNVAETFAGYYRALLNGARARTALSGGVQKARQHKA